jgi:hypothetical protein
VNGHPTKTLALLGKRCKNMVQLKWKGEKLVFFKGWSDFTRKANMVVDGTLVQLKLFMGFSPLDDDDRAMRKK